MAALMSRTERAQPEPQAALHVPPRPKLPTGHAGHSGTAMIRPMPNLPGGLLALTVLCSLGYWLNRVLPPVESRAVLAPRRLPNRGLRKVPPQSRANGETGPKRATFERAA